MKISSHGRTALHHIPAVLLRKLNVQANRQIDFSHTLCSPYPVLNFKDVLYSGCYYQCEAAQGGQGIGLIQPLRGDPISGQSHADLAFHWRPQGAEPAEPDPL